MDEVVQILGWAAFGTVTGAVVRLLRAGVKRLEGCKAVLLGALGAICGGALAHYLAPQSVQLLDLSGCVTAVAGAICITSGNLVHAHFNRNRGGVRASLGPDLPCGSRSFRTRPVMFAGRSRTATR
jgi:hypothetical protein